MVGVGMEGLAKDVAGIIMTSRFKGEYLGAIRSGDVDRFQQVMEKKTRRTGDYDMGTAMHAQEKEDAIMKLAFEEAMDNHRKLWNAIANEIEANGFRYANVRDMKKAVRDGVFPELKHKSIKEDCFLCEFALYHADDGKCRCSVCPMVDHPYKALPTHCLSDRFNSFCRAYHDKDRHASIRLAKEIAGLPVVNFAYHDRPDRQPKKPEAIDIGALKGIMKEVYDTLMEPGQNDDVRLGAELYMHSLLKKLQN